jgi:hypothetical protein
MSVSGDLLGPARRRRAQARPYQYGLSTSSVKSEHFALLPDEGSEASSHSENNDLIIDLPQWSAHCVERQLFYWREDKN